MKSRFWSFIVYPDSVIESWTNVLNEMGCVFAVSPLHDKDITPAGEVKKEHYHVIIQFDGPTTYKNVKENICDLIGATIPKKVISMRGMYRYLTHMDNPEKAQYDVKDIQHFGGFKYDLSESEITYEIDLICDDIDSNNILNYYDLISYYRSMGDLNRFEIVRKNTFFFHTYLRARKNLCTDV